jgi:hypothetical protein
VKRIVFISLAIALSACGNRTELRPKMGDSLPVKPLFAPATPAVSKLLTPDSQARPQRSDEQLDRSKQRRDDKFDLPPPG